MRVKTGCSIEGLTPVQADSGETGSPYSPLCRKRSNDGSPLLDGKLRLRKCSLSAEQRPKRASTCVSALTCAKNQKPKLNEMLAGRTSVPVVALDKILMQKLGLSEPPMTQSFNRRASTNFPDNSSPLLAESTTDATTALMSQGLRAAFAKTRSCLPRVWFLACTTVA